MAIDELRPSLRDDLTVTPIEGAGSCGFVLEDPLTSDFYRLGLAEYTFVSYLDGRTTLREALERTQQQIAGTLLTEQDAATLLRWLLDANLAYLDVARDGRRLARGAETADAARRWSRLNPFYLRIPLVRPARLLEGLEQWTAWFFSPVATVLALALVVVAFAALWQQWSRFVATSQGIFSPGGQLSLVGAWLLLKVLHETGHGLVCRRYGGHVREAGVCFILLFPVAFIDVTSSWRFRSKWQRIHTAAAGMYVELFVAAIAALIWCHTGRGPLNQLCANLVVMASFTTVLFNANPLMRYDGYYILSDLLEIPNLYTNGQQYMRYLSRKLLFGVPATMPKWPHRRALITKAYALTSFWWRLVVLFSLTLAAAALFHGAGIVLAALGIAMWFGLPAIRLAKYLLGFDVERPRTLRFIAVVGGATAAVTLLLLTVPWPGVRVAPAVVEYHPLTIVRANSSGFVREIHVQNGQLVEPGKLLVVLENEQLALDLAQLELSAEQSRLKARAYRQRGQMTEHRTELSELQALETRAAEKRIQLARLEVRAPVAGRVMRRRLDSLQDTYLKEGDEIVALGNDERKELRLSLAQQDVDQLDARPGTTYRVRLPGVGVVECRLASIAPRATIQPPHQSLCAPYGGPLTVRHDGKDEVFELLEPRFLAEAELDPAVGRRLYAGQRGTVTLTGTQPSIGVHLYRTLAETIDRRLAPRSAAR